MKGKNVLYSFVALTAYFSSFREFLFINHMYIVKGNVCVQIMFAQINSLGKCIFPLPNLTIKMKGKFILAVA